MRRCHINGLREWLIQAGKRQRICCMHKFYRLPASSLSIMAIEIYKMKKQNCANNSWVRIHFNDSCRSLVTVADCTCLPQVHCSERNVFFHPSLYTTLYIIIIMLWMMHTHKDVANIQSSSSEALFLFITADKCRPHINYRESFWNIHFNGSILISRLHTFLHCRHHRHCIANVYITSRHRRSC